LKLTFRGKLSIGILTGLGFSALLFADLVILLFFIAFLLLLLSELVWMTIISTYPHRFMILTKISSSENNEENGTRLVALGEASSQDFLLTMKTRSIVSLSSDTPYFKITPNQFEESTSNERLSIDFRSPFAGTFELSYVRAKVRGPLALYETSLKLGVSRVRFKVYPKVYDVALTTSKLVATLGIGEIPTEFRGIGTEFYDTREYQSGDDIRRVNWKASARLGKLIVNDHAKEIGASYYLVLDSNVTNYFDRNRLATTFLQIANNLAILGANFGVIIHNGKKVTSFKKMHRPYNSLSFALNAALDFAEIRKEELPPELTPLPSRMIRATRDVLSKEGLTLLSQIEDMAHGQMRENLNKGAFETILELVKENPPEIPALVFITPMNGSIAPIIEIADQLNRVYGAELIVINPTKPWVVARDENEGVKSYERSLSNWKALAYSKVRYYVGDPLDV
jgi:uncharacterized protein (DUF58 family)